MVSDNMLTDKERENKVLECFSARVKKELRRKHISQKALGEVTDIPPASISQYLNGRKDTGKYSECGIFSLAKIASVLNVSADYLLGLQKEKTTNPTISEIARFLGVDENALYSLHAFCSEDKNSALHEDYLFYDHLSELETDTIEEMSAGNINAVTALLRDNSFYSIARNIESALYALESAVESLEEWQRTKEETTLHKKYYSDFELSVFRCSRLFNQIIASYFAALEDRYILLLSEYEEWEQEASDSAEEE